MRRIWHRFHHPKKTDSISCRSAFVIIAVCFLTMGFEAAYLIYGLTKLSLFHPTFWDMPFFFLSHGGLFLTALLGFIYFMVTRKEAEKHGKTYLKIGYVLTFVCILFATTTSYRDFIAGRNTLLIYVIVCLSLTAFCTIDPFSYIGMVLVSEAILMVALSLNAAGERLGLIYSIVAIYTLLAVALGLEVYFYQVTSSIAEEKYRRLSTHDGLTGLRNRRSLDYVMNDAHSHGVRFVIMTDVNRFKQINDENGHEFGDKVLKDVSDVFREQFGHHVYRYGGDEFLVMVPALSQADFEKKLAYIMCHKPQIGAEYEVHFAAGYVHDTPADTEMLQKMIAEADKKMYAQKRAYAQ